MTYLNTIKWVDTHTNSLMLSLLVYNVNLEVYFIVRIFFENLGVYLKPSVDFGLVDVQSVGTGEVVK